MYHTVNIHTMNIRALSRRIINIRRISDIGYPIVPRDDSLSDQVRTEHAQFR